MSYVKHPQDFQRITALINPKIGWQQDLGCNVKYLYWQNFQNNGFFSYLQELAHLSHDNEFYFVDIYALSAIPAEKMYNFLNQYPVIKFSARMSQDEYYSLLSTTFGPIDGLYCNAMSTCTYAIFPDSMRWYIYGDYDIELAKLISTVGLPSIPFPGGFMNDNDALKLIALSE